MNLLRASSAGRAPASVRLDLKAPMILRPHTDHTGPSIARGSGARRFRALSWAARDGIRGMIAADRLPWGLRYNIINAS
jgi:hypothetical protein